MSVVVILDVRLLCLDVVLYQYTISDRPLVVELFIDLDVIVIGSWLWSLVALEYELLVVTYKMGTELNRLLNCYKWFW